MVAFRARGLDFEALEAELRLEKFSYHMSHSLNSLKGGYMGDYIGDYYRGY